jgi:hypothetical protein
MVMDKFDSFFEKEVRQVYKVIKKAGTIQKSILTRKTQNINSIFRNDILFTLIQRKKILERKDFQTKKTWYSTTIQ